MNMQCWIRSAEGRHFFLGALGKDPNPVSFFTPIFRLDLPKLLPKFVPSNGGSDDSTWTQICHFHPIGFVCYCMLQRVGTGANQTFSWHCIPRETKFLTRMLPFSLRMAPWIRAPRAASLSMSKTHWLWLNLSFQMQSARRTGSNSSSNPGCSDSLINSPIHVAESCSEKIHSRSHSNQWALLPLNQSSWKGLHRHHLQMQAMCPGS